MFNLEIRKNYLLKKKGKRKETNRRRNFSRLKPAQAGL